MLFIFRERFYFYFFMLPNCSKYRRKHILTKAEQPTKGFASWRLDGIIIGSKSLSTIIRQTERFGALILNLNIYQPNQHRYRRDGMLISCHRKYEFVRKFSRYEILHIINPHTSFANRKLFNCSNFGR